MIRIVFGVLVIVTGCQQLKPESVSIPDYPDYGRLMEDQIELLRNSRTKKEVWLDGRSEVKVMNMDSAKWEKELSFLKEINPNQPEYVGAFEKTGDELNQTLSLASGERGALKQTSYSRSDEGFNNISAIFHEDKDVYVHHREISLNFKDGILESLNIDGYQKMMFNDTVRFRINLEVN